MKSAPLVIFGLGLLCLVSGCAAYMHGYTEGKSINRYLLVDAGADNFGHQRLRYAMGFHPPLREFVASEGIPLVIYSFKNEEQRESIRLYYPDREKVIVFAQVNWMPASLTLKETRALTAEERAMVKRLAPAWAKTKPPPLVPLLAPYAVKGPDVPAATAGPGERPLWLMNVTKDSSGRLGWQYAAVDRGGRRLVEFEKAGAIAWSPDGKQYAFASFPRPEAHQINIKSIDGGQRVVRLISGRAIIPWQVAWAPDGKRLAFLAYARDAQAKTTEHSLIVMSTEWGASTNPFLAEHKVPAATLANFPPLFAPPDKLRWSSDGQRILISWGNTLVVEVRDGKQTLIHPERAAAAWSPNGDGVYYLALSGSDSPRDRRWTGVYLQRLDGSEPVRVADAERLAELGMMRPGFNNGTLDFSPDGTALALAGGDGASKCALHILPVANDGMVQWRTPLGSHREIGVVAALDWAPDSRSLAAVTLPSAEAAGKNPSLIEVATTVLSRTASAPKVLHRVQIPAGPAYLDYVGQSKLISWSH